MIEVELYLDERGRSPFERWRADLDAMTRVQISKALERLVVGNTSNVKGLSGGVCELKIDKGPGYRFISAAKGIGSSSCSAVARKRGSRGTSPKL